MAKLSSGWDHSHAKHHVSRLGITAPWSVSRRMLGVHPICSRARFIGLIYASAGSHSEGPARLSTEAGKEAQVEIIVSLVHIGKM